MHAHSELPEEDESLEAETEVSMSARDKSDILLH